MPQVGLTRLGAGHYGSIKPAVPKVVNAVIKAGQTLLSPIAAGNLGQGVKLEMHRDTAGRSIEKFEKLRLGVFQRGVRHVVDERDLDTLSARAITVGRCHRAQTVLARPKRRNSTSIYHQWHDLPPQATTTNYFPNLMLLPWPA